MLAAVCVASALWWAWSLYATLRSMRALRRLDSDRSPPPARWPRVSIVVAARDEERDLEAGIRSRLADGYPDVQVVVATTDRATAPAPSPTRFASTSVVRSA